MSSSFGTIIAGGLVGLGIATGGFLAGESLVKSRLGYRVVTVKGLSERQVEANLGFWPIRSPAPRSRTRAASSRLRKRRCRCS
jgi:uncharacterized protein